MNMCLTDEYVLNSEVCLTSGFYSMVYQAENLSEEDNTTYLIGEIQ